MASVARHAKIAAKLAQEGGSTVPVNGAWMLPEEVAFFPFKQSAGKRPPRMDRADTLSAACDLPQKSAEPMMSTESSGKDPLPMVWQHPRRGELGATAGNFTALPTVVAIAALLSWLFGSRKISGCCGQGQALGLNPPFDLQKESTSLQENLPYFVFFQTLRIALPDRFPVQCQNIAD